jgi:hypothetical protein
MLARVAALAVTTGLINITQRSVSIATISISRRVIAGQAIAADLTSFIKSDILRKGFYHFDLFFIIDFLYLILYYTPLRIYQEE